MRIESHSSRGSIVPSVTNVSFCPKATINCIGAPSFRSKAARDLACLLDVDPEVESWVCLPLELSLEDFRHTPDFLVSYVTGQQRLLDACDAADARVPTAAAGSGYTYQFVGREEREHGWRLRNARDLLRYGNHKCPLGDRIRVIAALDEVGSFSIAEGLSLFREITPVAGLAVLVLQRMVSMDLDEALIGPETIVRRVER
jgi:hypothetical protein